MVKYSPRNRNMGTATATANSAANSPPARTEGIRPRPADTDSFAVA